MTEHAEADVSYRAAYKNREYCTVLCQRKSAGWELTAGVRVLHCVHDTTNKTYPAQLRKPYSIDQRNAKMMPSGRTKKALVVEAHVFQGREGGERVGFFFASKQYLVYI